MTTSKAFGNAAKLRSVFNPMDPVYGARGDGVTDDTAAYRALVAAMKTAGGGLLYIPRGTYLVTPDSTSIGTAWNFSSGGGDWYAAMLIDFDDFEVCAEGDAVFTFPVLSGSRCNSVFGIKGSSGTPLNRIAIRGVNFNLQDRSSANAIYAQFANEVTVEYCGVRNHDSTIDVMSFDNTKGVLVGKNTFREGAIAIGLYEAVNTRIIGNDCYNVGELLDADKPVTSGTGTAAHNLTVMGNTYDRDSADSTFDGAIEVNGFNGVTITGNAIRKSNNGIHLTAKVRNATNYALQRCAVTGNTLEDVNGIGINMGSNGTDGFVNFNDVSIQGNTVDSSGGVGIRLRGSGVVCRGNIVRSATGIGINALNVGSSQNLTNFVVSENQVTGCSSDGIQLDTSTNGVVSNNNVYSNTDTNGGIYLATPTKVTVSGNMTSGHTNAGIRTFAGAGEVLLMGNLCTETNGIRVATAGLQFALGNHANYFPGADASRNLHGPTIAWGTAAPTAGTWAQGSIVWRTDSTANEHPGWVCTAAGTPGTWKAMANVAA